MGSSSDKENPDEQQRNHEGSEHSDVDLLSVHNRLMYERKDPAAKAFSWVPLMLVACFSVLAFWGGIYVIRYSGAFRWDIYDGKEDAHASVDTTPAVFDPMKAGAKFYKNNCVVCHQANGMGVPGAFPQLAGSDWVQGSEERLAKILLHGMQGEIQVNGSTYNGAMPEFGHASDRDLAAVLTWIRTNDWGNDAAPVSEEFVASVRAATSAQTKPWNGPDLMVAYP